MFLVCGEALFDFFLESEAGPAAATYAARAGGSPFNVAIGLARLGRDSGLLTGLSSDLLGQRLAQVLEAEGVSTRYAIPTDRPTTLSLVGLDAAGVPAYQFYDNGSADTGVQRGRPAGAGDRGGGAALRFLFAGGGAGRRRDGGAGAGEGRAVRLGRSRTCGRRWSRTWMSGASGWRCSSRWPTS